MGTRKRRRESSSSSDTSSSVSEESGRDVKKRTKRREPRDGNKSILFAKKKYKQRKRKSSPSSLSTSDSSSSSSSSTSSDSSSSSDTSSSSSSRSSNDSSSERHRKRVKEDRRKIQGLKTKAKKHKGSVVDTKNSTSNKRSTINIAKATNETKKEGGDDGIGSTDIPLALMEKPNAMAPMTKEQWQQKQNVVKRVFDVTTGRHRLIRGDGEVIEEIVSRERHKAINQQATKGDGDFFQSAVNSYVRK